MIVTTITVDKDDERRLLAALDGAADKLPKEIMYAIRATARKTRLESAREIKKEIAMLAREVKSIIKIRKATVSDLTSDIYINETARPGLSKFKAEQDKVGVKAKIRTKGGKTRIKHAFMGPSPERKLPRWKDNAFKREGRSRLKIIKLHGASPWGVFVKKKLEVPVTIDTDKELTKQINRRIRQIILRKNKLI